MKPVTLFGIALFLLGLAAAGLSWLLFSGATEQVQVRQPSRVEDTRGQEGQFGGLCDFANGWNICPIGGANLPDFYRRYKPVVGLPIGRFNPSNSCQSFQNARLCVGTTSGFEVEISNTGLEELERRRLQVNSRSVPHAAVADWIRSLVAAGADRDRAVGRIISAPLPSDCSETCQQIMDKVVLEFPQNSLYGDDVKIVPIEQMLATTAPGPTMEDRSVPPARNVPLIVGVIIGAILAIVGFVAFLYGGFTGEGGMIR